MIKPRALIISPYPFYPVDAGGKIVIYNNTKFLSQFFEIEILIPAPIIQRDMDALETLRRQYKIHCIEPRKLNFLEKTMFYQYSIAAFSKYPLGNMCEFYNHPHTRQLITDDFAFIQLNHAWWYHSILQQRRGKLVLIEHNYETEYWQEMGKSLLKHKKYIKGLCYILGSTKIFQQEKEAINDSDLILTLSDREKEIIKRISLNPNKVHTVITGVDTESYETFNEKKVPKTSSNEINLIYVGSLNTPQTAGGAIFFIKKVFPMLKKDSNHIYKLFLIGRDPIKELKKLVQNDTSIILTGFVEDVRPYIAKADIYIVPLLHGSGIRFKIMEAMAMGKPIVSTKKGAEGLDLDNCGIIITDNIYKFRDAIQRLAENDELRSNFSKINQQYANTHFDNKRIFEQRALPLYRKLFI